MGFRFRKSIKLAPGLRMNVSSSGVSCNIGPRGASISVGKRRTYLNTSIPGTGFSARERISGPSQRAQQTPSRVVIATVTVSVDDDGAVRFCDEEGKTLSETMITTAKRQHGASI